MNNILEDITSNLNFLNPYFKQFRNHLTGKNIIILETSQSNAKFYFTNEDIVSTNIKTFEELDSYPNIDGIIINNYSCSEVDELLSKTYKCLKDDGIMLFIFNNQVYDKETINFLVKEKFTLIEELIGDDRWNFILYSKKTTK